LPPGSFPVLEELEIIETSPTLSSLRFCLLLEPNGVLDTLTYNALDRVGPPVDRTSLDQLLQHMAQFKSLRGFSLSIGTSQALSLAEYRIFHAHFHALPALNRFAWNTDAHIVIDSGIVHDFLDACPFLRFWTMQHMHHTHMSLAEFTLPEFLNLLLRHPEVHEVPVRVRCDVLPDPCGLEEVYYGTGTLTVQDVQDPAAVAKVLRKALPRVVYVLPVSYHDDNLNAINVDNIIELECLLKMREEVAEAC
jgi:hypothetical protein